MSQLVRPSFLWVTRAGVTAAVMGLAAPAHADDAALVVEAMKCAAPGVFDSDARRQVIHNMNFPY